jgi:hypothetical protein
VAPTIADQGKSQEYGLDEYERQESRCHPQPEARQEYLPDGVIPRRRWLRRTSINNVAGRVKREQGLGVVSDVVLPSLVGGSLLIRWRLEHWGSAWMLLPISAFFIIPASRLWRMWKARDRPKRPEPT